MISSSKFGLVIFCNLFYIYFFFFGEVTPLISLWKKKWFPCFMLKIKMIVVNFIFQIETTNAEKSNLLTTNQQPDDLVRTFYIYPVIFVTIRNGSTCLHSVLLSKSVFCCFFLPDLAFSCPILTWEVWIGLSLFLTGHRWRPLWRAYTRRTVRSSYTWRPWTKIGKYPAITTI